MALVAGLATRCGGSVVSTMPESPIGPPWTVAAKIDPATAAGGYDDYPRLGVSRRGDMVAVWAHHVVRDGTYVRNGLRASRFFPESGWDPISTIPGIDDEYGESIAMDDDGLAIVVGTIADWSLPHRVWASRARPGSPWSALELVPPGPGDAQSPRVVLPLPGLAVVTWLGADGTHGKGWSSVDDGGWTPAQPLSLLGNFRIYSPNLVTDGSGHALATWFEPPLFDEGPVFANVPGRPRVDGGTVRRFSGQRSRRWSRRLRPRARGVDHARGLDDEPAVHSGCALDGRNAGARKLRHRRAHCAERGRRRARGLGPAERIGEVRGVGRHLGRVPGMGPGSPRRSRSWATSHVRRHRPRRGRLGW
jgi:hypothetical protein